MMTYNTTDVSEIKSGTDVGGAPTLAVCLPDGVWMQFRMTREAIDQARRALRECDQALR